MSKYIFIITLALNLIFLESTFARPQYAATSSINSCTMCHTSPTGGGFRNLMGKSFAFKGYEPSKFASQEWVSADVRAIYSKSENSDKNSGGMDIMTGVLSLNIPIMDLTKDQPEARLIYSHNITGNAVAARREVYLRLKFRQEYEASFKPQYLMVGRFHLPFGLMTDEHRTYTKMQSKSSWNDFGIGAMISSNVTNTLHYDLAVVNDKPDSSGGGFAAERATTWGGVVNLRWAPESKFVPVLGVSYSYYDKKEAELKEASAGAVYSIFPLSNFTGGLIDGSLSVEYSEAQQMNNGYIKGFFDPALMTANVDSRSKAWLAQLDYNLTDRFILTYKFDDFTPSKDFSSDYYSRHGFGFSYYFGPNMLIKSRYETTKVKHSNKSTDGSRGALEGFWAMLQLSI